METITLTLEQYLATFPEPEKFGQSSPGLKLIPEENSMRTLYGKCDFRGPEINIPKVCKNVVERSPKILLIHPLYLVHVASILIHKAPFVTYVDCFELVMWHMVNELNTLYKRDKVAITVELGEKERRKAGLDD